MQMGRNYDALADGLESSPFDADRWAKSYQSMLDKRPLGRSPVPSTSHTTNARAPLKTENERPSNDRWSFASTNDDPKQQETS